MPLVTENKGTPAIPASKTPTSRVEVVMGRPSSTTARTEALKARLTGQPTNNPAPPRVAGSSARADQYSKLQSYAPPPQSAQTDYVQPMQNVEPPPGGMPAANEAPVQDAAPQINNNVETEPVETEAASQPLSPQFVALAKREQAIRKARQELKSQQEAWEREKAAYVNLEQLKADPIKALNELGLTYDKLTELQLSQLNPDPNQQLLDKIAQLESKLASVDEQFVNRDKQAYTAAVNQIRNDVKLLVDSDPSFETIKETGETESVVELIEKVFQKEGTILAVEEAARLVEDKLLENKIAEIEKLTKLQKIKSRLGKLAEPPAEAAKAPQPQTTLSNNGAVQRTLSPRERAILKIQEMNESKVRQ